MCKLGDIIVVNKYIGDDGKLISKHSFIVIDNNPDCIKGLNYNLVATVISSFKSQERKKRKLQYKENMEICEFEQNGTKKFRKPSYIKADKLFYFDKEKLDYYIFGRISDDLLDELVKLIIELSNEEKLVQVIDNLK